MRTQISKVYKTALYIRLSKEDEGSTESSSILTQRKMLSNYAMENHFIVHDEYVDDGFSGTNFERPAFKRLIEDIEQGYINLVITKDLSRLGRDYIQTGQYTECYFPEHNVRYIAINDGYDSDSQFNDIAPFKNIINEMYARDISKKIRSSINAKMREGEYIGCFPPYGYIKDPSNKNHLLIDYGIANIVKKIFSLAENGRSPGEIADYLNKNDILTPLEYRYTQNPNILRTDISKGAMWTASSVSKILKNIVYLGHMAQGKSSKVSFKSKMLITKPRDEWIVVENTHEPLVSEHTFDMVNRCTRSRKHGPNGNFYNIFSGIAFCADCGRAMSTVGTRKKGSIYNLVCGAYKLYGRTACSNHFIDYEGLYQLVLSDIQKQLRLSKEDKEQILESLDAEPVNCESKDKDAKKLQNEITKRIHELDKIIQRLYEDNVSGKINNERFEKIFSSYESEQTMLKDQLKKLFEAEEHRKKERSMVKDFYKLLEKVTDMEELTPDILHYLVDSIRIEQGHYEQSENGKIKVQKVHIYYKFAGEMEQ